MRRRDWNFNGTLVAACFCRLGAVEEGALLGGGGPQIRRTRSRRSHVVLPPFGKRGERMGHARVRSVLTQVSPEEGRTLRQAQGRLSGTCDEAGSQLAALSDGLLVRSEARQARRSSPCSPGWWPRVMSCPAPRCRPGRARCCRSHSCGQPARCRQQRWRWCSSARP